MDYRPHDNFCPGLKHFIHNDVWVLDEFARALVKTGSSDMLKPWRCEQSDPRLEPNTPDDIEAFLDWLGKREPLPSKRA